MNITIKINCDNAAFEDSPEAEVSGILTHLAEEITEGERMKPGDIISLFDSNGNKVGFYKVTR